jgi:MFS family permease
MFVLRFFAGPLVHRLSPLGLLAASAAIGALGLLWLSQAGTAVWVLFAAATFYGLGKTFFWPTTLGVVSEQYPRGGALMLNAIAGVGMISVGTIGNPAIGAIQDSEFTQEIREVDPALASQVLSERAGLFGESEALDPMKRAAITDPQAQATITAVDARTKQATLSRIAILPAIMLLCYIGLILYFKSRGGYRPRDITEGVREAERKTTAVAH